MIKKKKKEKKKRKKNLFGHLQSIFSNVVHISLFLL
jgi:hypothetical protein